MEQVPEQQKNLKAEEENLRQHLLQMLERAFQTHWLLVTHQAQLSKPKQSVHNKQVSRYVVYVCLR